MVKEIQSTKKDYASNQEVKWCSGCGDYSVLKQVQIVLADLKLKNEEVVFISGIGCSSRFPYYLNTYGYHTLHGRAMPVATGVKCQNPDLSVWVSIGDGDAVSIGGNHFIHAAKRNLNLNVILMDNRIYGLTKGQVSPTSEKGKITKTTPYGSLDGPMDPVKLAIGAGATFVARATDRHQKLIRELLIEANNHKGFSLVHIMQNCLIFNNDAFDDYIGKEKDENTIILEHGKPMIFGKQSDKAIILEDLKPKIVNVSDVETEQLTKYNAQDEDSAFPHLISSLSAERFPLPLGIIRQVEQETYDEALHNQLEEVTKKQGAGDFQQLLNGKNAWTIN